MFISCPMNHGPERRNVLSNCNLLGGTGDDEPCYGLGRNSDRRGHDKRLSIHPNASLCYSQLSEERSFLFVDLCF